MFNKFIQQMSDDIPYLRAVVMDIVSAIARFIGSRDPSIDFHRLPAVCKCTDRVGFSRDFLSFFRFISTYYPSSKSCSQK